MQNAKNDLFFLIYTFGKRVKNPENCACFGFREAITNS